MNGINLDLLETTGDEAPVTVLNGRRYCIGMSIVIIAPTGKADLTWTLSD